MIDAMAAAYGNIVPKVWLDFRARMRIITFLHYYIFISSTEIGFAFKTVGGAQAMA